jgi:hypothetical protein
MKEDNGFMKEEEITKHIFQKQHSEDIIAEF